jgi:GntR family transcriptional regulator / MocR family aminotransferase
MMARRGYFVMAASNWTLTLALDRHASLPPFLQIARALAGEIERGRFRPGDRLPGSRSLAELVGVHRNTVIAALQELLAEGWLETSPGRGTFIAANLPAVVRHTRRAAARPASSNRLPFPLADVTADYRQPPLPRGTLNLSSGAPDVRLVPARILGRAYRRALSLRSSELLAYGDAAGHPALREALAAMLCANRGLSARADDVVITRGSQMALTLIARALLRPGDVIAVEQPGYRPAWEAFRAAGATVVPVRVDQDGLDVDAVRRLAHGRKLRAVYVTPHHQYPTTVTLKAARRLALLALARTERFAIIEDDYDFEFHYDGRPVLPLASTDHGGTVVYVGTLSKILAPGLRLGYVVAAPSLLNHIGALRSLLDIQGDLATEAAVADMIQDGELQRHVARVRRVYQQRREILSSALTRTFKDDAEFALSPGGMALWVKFRMAVDWEDWVSRGLARGVFWYTGRRYAFDQRSTPFARFSFAWLNDRELPEAVRRMAAALPPGTR